MWTAPVHQMYSHTTEVFAMFQNVVVALSSCCKARFGPSIVQTEDPLGSHAAAVGDDEELVEEARAPNAELFVAARRGQRVGRQNDHSPHAPRTNLLNEPVVVRTRVRTGRASGSCRSEAQGSVVGGVSACDGRYGLGRHTRRLRTLGASARRPPRSALRV